MKTQTILFLGVLGLMTACLVGFMQLYHMFYTVEIDVKKFPEITVAYSSYIGDLDHYIKEIDVVSQYLARINDNVDYNNMPSFSISYDRRGQPIGKNDHRYVVGKVIPEDLFDDNEKARIRKLKINITKIDLNKCAYVNYPYDSEMALTGGKIRSYPKLLEWINTTGSDYYPTTRFVELYNYEPKTVTFLVPLGKRRGLLTKFVKL